MFVSSLTAIPGWVTVFSVLLVLDLGVWFYFLRYLSVSRGDILLKALCWLWLALPTAIGLIWIVHAEMVHAIQLHALRFEGTGFSEAAKGVLESGVHLSVPRWVIGFVDTYVVGVGMLSGVTLALACKRRAFGLVPKGLVSVPILLLLFGVFCLP